MLLILCVAYFKEIRYYKNKLRSKPLEIMGHKAIGSKRRMPQDSLTARPN